MEVFEIPVVDTNTGEGWDQEVVAEDAQSALDQLDVGESVVVASNWMKEHFETP